MFVRRVFESAIVFYSPHHFDLFDLIQNMQRRLTKRLYEMHNICYADKLKFFNLEFLALHADLIILYKILNESIRMNLNNCIIMFIIPETFYLSNRLKLQKFLLSWILGSIFLL